MVELSEHNFNEMMSALTSGLQYDRAQHKQYYLEKALKHLIGEKAMLDLKEREGWEDGLPA